MEGGTRAVTVIVIDDEEFERRGEKLEWRNDSIASNVAFFGSLGRVSWKTIGQRRVRARGTQQAED